ALSVSLAVRAGDALSSSRRSATSLAVAAATAAAISMPLLLPYWTAHREQGLERGPGEAAEFASTPASYLATPARLHYSLWSRRYFGARGGAGFPGVAALALALLGAVRAGWRSGWARSLVAVAIAGFVLSLGPATPAYAALRLLFPPMKTLRDPSRFVYLVL